MVQNREIMAAIEHSENKRIKQSGPFKNEIGPGVLQSGLQQACTPGGMREV